MPGRLYGIVRWLLGGIFIYAGTTKLMAPEAFSVLLQAYGILPDQLLMVVAIALPGLEMVAGFGLLFDVRGSLGAIGALLGLFVAILGYGIWMGLDVDCGCFGSGDPEAGSFHSLKFSLARNLIMLPAVCALYAWRRHRGIIPIRVRIAWDVTKRVKERSRDDGYR